MKHAREQVRIPRDVRMLGVIVDAENAKVVPELIRISKNSDAVGLLSAWKRSGDQFPYLVFAGQLHRETGLVGGMARTWHEALIVFRMASQRLDELARSGGSGFSTAWLMVLTPERKAEVQALIGDLQQTAGAA